MLPTLRSRTVRVVDAALCASWLQRDCVYAADLERNLTAVLEHLFFEERLQGVIVESYDGATHNWMPQGIGLSGFAAPELIDIHLRKPGPFLLQTILASYHSGAPNSFLDLDQQARVNSGLGAGMDIVAHWMQQHWDLVDPFWRAVGTMAHQAYVRDHRGYRINRMLHEDWVRHVDIYLMFGYRSFATFEMNDHPGRPSTCRDMKQRTLYYIDTGEIALRAPGSTASFVLQFVAPVCRFTRAEKRLLRRAVSGMTDLQIGHDLGLSQNTLKSTWRSIYDRVQSHAPYVIARPEIEKTTNGARGAEKRRSVVAFVESHPQELRPYCTV